MAYCDIDLSVRCPYCQAGHGQHCRIRTLMRQVRWLSNPHRARIHKANAKVAESARRAGG